MAVKNPEIVAGARGPRSTRTPKESADQVQGQVPEGQVWYQSKYARYRIQLTAPKDVHLPDGRVKTDAPIVAQFEGAMLKLNLKKEKDRNANELLQEHENLGTMFWNFQDVLDKKRADERERAITVLQDPEQKRLIVEALRAEGVDFALPAPNAKSQKPKAGEDGPAKA